MKLRNKIALVTGAQQGIGLAIARAFGGEGAGVVLNYYDSSTEADAVVGRDFGGRRQRGRSSS